MSAVEQRSAMGHGFGHLLSPLALRGAVLPNRVVMGAMHTRIEALDRAPERIRAFYRARAEGDVGMIITGGVAPNVEGRVEEGAPVMSANADMDWHRAIVESVAGTSTLMCLQILHTGRYARFEGCVAPSAIRSRINRHAPRALTTDEGGGGGGCCGRLTTSPAPQPSRATSGTTPSRSWAPRAT